MKLARRLAIDVAMKFWSCLGVLASAVGLIMACDDSSNTPEGSDVDGGGPSQSKDASTDRQTTDARDAEPESQDDASSDAAPSSDAGGAGAECYFNTDCQLALRCECDESTGCSCRPGTRGAGAAGATCSSGNDCSSSVCIDDTTCSRPCNTESDCPPALPQCLLVFGFPEKICSPN